MWQKSYSKIFPNVKPEAIWQVWTDINNWHTWNPGVESGTLTQPFAEGSSFTLKPKGASPVEIKLVAVKDGHSFTDCTSFPGAKMYGMHIMDQTNEGLRLTTIMTIKGPLGFVWRKIVGEKIAAKAPEQTDALVARAKNYGQ